MFKYLSLFPLLVEYGPWVPIPMTHLEGSQCFDVFPTVAFRFVVWVVQPAMHKVFLSGFTMVKREREREKESISTSTSTRTGVKTRLTQSKISRLALQSNCLEKNLLAGSDKFVGNRPKNCLHHCQMLQIVVCLEQGLSSDEFHENATDWPYITRISPPQS